MLRLWRAELVWLAYMTLARLWMDFGLSAASDTSRGKSSRVTSKARLGVATKNLQLCSSCVWVPQILTRPLSIDLVLGEDVEGGPLQGTQTAAGA